MKKRIVNRGIALWVMGLLTVSMAFGQKSYEDNKLCTGIFERLNKEFPLRFLLREGNEGVIYDFDYKFKNAEERLKYKPMFDEILREMAALKSTRRYVMTVDSTGIDYVKHQVTSPSKREGQSDYISLEVSNKSVSFKSRVNAYGVNRDAVLPLSYRVCEEIETEMGELRKKYLSGADVKQTTTTYNWAARHNYRRYIIGDGFSGTKMTRAIKHHVPACKKKDYDAFYKKFKEIMSRYNVFIASCAVFGEYPQAVMAYTNPEGKMIHYGVALKPDGTLCLIRSTGSSLPRLWPEKDASNWNKNRNK